MILLSLLLASSASAAPPMNLYLESCEFRFTKPTLKLEVHGRTFTDNLGAELSWTVRNDGPDGKFHLHTVHGPIGRDYSDKKNPFGLSAIFEGQTELELKSGARATVRDSNRWNSVYFQRCEDRLYLEIGTSQPAHQPNSVWMGKVSCLTKVKRTPLRMRCKVIR